MSEDSVDEQYDLPEDELHRLLLKNRESAFSAEEEQRRLVEEEIKFVLVEDNQWDEQTSRLRQDRPMYTINRCIGALNQILGEMRRNRVDIKARPRGGRASAEMADVINGIIRSIENESNFDYIGDVAAKEAFAGGFGAFMVEPDYIDEESFDNSQEIKFKAIHSACTSVWFDPASRDEHHRDAMWCQVDCEISKEEHKSRWPDKPMLDVTQSATWETYDWQERDTVRIADVWRREPYKKRIAEFSDGTTKEITEDVEMVLDEMAEEGLTIVKEKEIDSFRIFHYKINGGCILDGPNKWAGNEIPVVPLYASQIWLGGNHYYSGLVRWAKDPQRLYNYITSSKVEETAVSLGSKLVMTRAMIQGNEEFISDPNPITPLVVNPDPRVPGGLPIKLASNQMNTALVEQAAQADQDIQATLGVYSQNLGNNPRQQSGKALMAQREQMQVSSSELQNNFARAKVRAGEIIIDMIPKIIDTPRQQRIISEDGDAKMVELNKTVIDAETGKEVIVENDITIGKYDIVSDVGPSYKTQREETQEKMLFIAQTAPELSKLVIPVILENDPSPAARKLADVLSMQNVREGLAEPNDKQREILEREQAEKAQQGPSPEEIAMQLAIKKAEAEARKVEAEAMKIQLEIQQSQAEAQLAHRRITVDIEKTESETVKNYAQAEKSERDANEPYQAQRPSQ